MTFGINGIKQDKDRQHTVALLMHVDTPDLARQIFEHYQILILSLKKFSQDPKTFGNVYAIIDYNKQRIQVTTPYKDIQTAALMLITLGFDLIEIHTYIQPISSQASDLCIADAKATRGAADTQQAQEMYTQAATTHDVYQDAQLEIVKQALPKIFDKIDVTTKRATGLISTQELQQIKTFTEELKKLRMGNNVEKITATIQQLFDLLDRIDSIYYAQLPNTLPISSTSLVTEQDISREAEKLENIKLLQSLGAKISLKNKDYSLFGISAIVRKFLQKDILTKMVDLRGILYRAPDIVELILTMSIAAFGVYTIANDRYLFVANQFGLAYMLIDIGIRGIVVFCIRYMRNKNIGRLLLIWLIAIGLHAVLLWSVTTNFAL